MGPQNIAFAKSQKTSIGNVQKMRNAKTFLLTASPPPPAAFALRFFLDTHTSHVCLLLYDVNRCCLVLCFDVATSCGVLFCSDGQLFDHHRMQLQNLASCETLRRDVPSDARYTKSAEPRIVASGMFISK